MADVKLFLGDCLDILPTLEAQSVDAILTDLPYGTTACKWDEIIPFVPMWEQVKRLLKPRGAFVTTASQPFTSKLIVSNLDWFKYEWIWEKSKAAGYLDAERKPLRSHENILMFSKNGHTYNPQKWQIAERFVDRRKQRTRYEYNPAVYGHPIGKSERKEDDGYRYPLSVISIESEWKKGMHPNQKPVALYEYLVHTYTNEGDTVLDFCMGSGTTIIAAIKNGRHAIGIEKDAHYFDVASGRIAEAQK